ncbi:hypothetical protein A9Q82_07675 [Cycloclasticus sp. 46_120_T64]|nr:hypothetical protein A9Q82_07675 [Cycloclasticus sp. 46_120_T64]
MKTNPLKKWLIVAASLLFIYSNTLSATSSGLMKTSPKYELSHSFDSSIPASPAKPNKVFWLSGPLLGQTHQSQLGVAKLTTNDTHKSL